ncbi:unnamed protein product, partial [marine sediment metagenome]
INKTMPNSFLEKIIINAIIRRKLSQGGIGGITIKKIFIHLKIVSNI